MLKIDQESLVLKSGSGLFQSILKYPWNATLYSGMFGQMANSFLGLINQIVYYNNPNPLYNRPGVYDNTSSKIYIRGGKNAMSSTISYGMPYF